MVGVKPLPHHFFPPLGSWAWFVLSEREGLKRLSLGPCLFFRQIMKSPEGCSKEMH